MSSLSYSDTSTQSELYTFLNQAVSRLRWVTLIIVLLFTLLFPAPDGAGWPSWAAVGAFAAYNLVTDIIRSRASQQRALLWLAIFDLPIAGLLYLLDTEPGGPSFVLLVLAVDSAAAVLSIRATLCYTLVIALIATLIDVFMSIDIPTASDFHQLGTRLIVLILLGCAMAILTRRLALEQVMADVANDQATQLSTLNHIRVEFIATISHELRTPLTAAHAALALVAASADQHYSPDQRRLLDNARRNVERLNVLIGDLLTHNELEAGTFQLARQSCDLRAVVENSIATLYPLLQEKQQHINVELPEALPMIGDTPRLEQVIVNLLANAHKHTHVGSTITVAGHITPDVVHLSVRDNGAGIDKIELERIFQRFYRISVTEQGSGLGLSIAQRIIQLHGGSIWAESKPNVGTVFQMTLPRLVQEQNHGITPADR